MPYGMPDPENQDARMERCVNDLMARGRDKTSAIKICKAGIIKADAKKEKDG
jgi:hypothetical protein